MCSTDASFIKFIDYTIAALGATPASGDLIPRIGPLALSAFATGPPLCFNTCNDAHCGPLRNPVLRHKQLPRQLTYKAVIFAVTSVIAVTLTFGCFGPSEQELAREHYEQGLKYEEHGSYLRARQEFTHAIRRDRGFTEAYVAQSRALLQTNNVRAAMASVNQALQLDEDLVEAHDLRGRIYTYMGDSESAILSFTRAIQLDPEYADAYHNRARVNLDDGNVDSALEDLSKAIELRPFEAVYYMQRAQFYSHLDERDRALRDLERVLEITQDEELTTTARRMMENIRQAP